MEVKQNGNGESRGIIDFGCDCGCIAPEVLCPEIDNPLCS